MERTNNGRREITITIFPFQHLWHSHFCNFLSSFHAHGISLVGLSSRFVLSRWIVSSCLVCCVFLEYGCLCLSLESRHLCPRLFVIENGGRLEGKWIRGLDMIPSMIFIYGRTSVSSPFVFFFSILMLCLEETRKINKHCM